MRLTIILTLATILCSCAPKPEAKKFSPTQYSGLMQQARNYRIK